MAPPHSTPLEAKPQDRATARGHRGAEGCLAHAAGRRPGRPAAADIPAASRMAAAAIPVRNEQFLG